MPDALANLVQVYRRSCDTYAERPLFGQRTDGEWTWLTYGEFARLVDRFRGGLAELGVGRGDRVAIVSDNRVQWAVAAYATYGLEATFVPMYEAQLPKEWKFILADCEAKVVIASTAKIHDTLAALKDELPRLEHVVGLDQPADDPDSYAALLDRGEAHPVDAADPDPQTVAGFIYTSGTTGNPKGVILTHRNIASNLAAVREVFPIEPDDRTLSFLPWAHSFGQTCELHYGMSSGASLALNDAIPNLVRNLTEVRPTLLVAVPRIFNRIYDGVVGQIEERPALVRKLFWDGIRAAAARGRGESVGWLRDLELRLDDRLIFSKIRERFGGRLKFVISGSAALSPEVAQFIDALGIVVYEGYGLSETSPVVTCNFPGVRKVGTVGKPIPGVEVRIDTSMTSNDHEGEIVVYGPNVTQGYHNRPEENAKLFSEDGGLRTGDLGCFDDDGFLRVTGRIKEQYKLENGKYVMPAPLEESLKISHYIANVMLHGANRPYNVAVVVPDRAAIEIWAEHEGVEIGETLATEGPVISLIERELAEHGSGFKGYERPRKFIVIEEDFTPDNDMLTPTLKLKRRNVMARYGVALEALYREVERASAK